ncbi:MAG: GTP 3',8-cyclase MoaA, partial [Candidatus Verstraetearchaeota archaeon]|nr:GTP 3',8-cyclase MoaA [Candidatus Verstraetearchaeota archaeon]
KHSHHSSTGDADKDTWRFREAGAAASALLGAGNSATFVFKGMPPEKALDVFSYIGPHLVLCEGLKDSDLPKIAIVEEDEIENALQLRSLVAVVVDHPRSMTVGVPVLPYDPISVAKFVEERYLMPAPRLVDPFGRRIHGIRISLTQRCNLNCLYCHHEGELSSSAEMTTEEVVRVIRVARDLGVRRVKFTGGEPLLRSDLEVIISSSWSLGLEDVSVTTNGQLLEERASSLYGSGLRRLNISIPSADPRTYRAVTGGDLGRVVSGLWAARSRGISVKINTVVMRGINDSEIEKMVEFAKRNASSLQFVELEDLRLEKGFFEKYHADLSGVEAFISQMADRSIERGEMNRRRVYWIGDFPVEIVRPVNNPEFCSACTRIRVTSDGKLKPCLMRGDFLIDLLGPMRSGCQDDRLKALFMEAVSKRTPFYK